MRSDTYPIIRLPRENSGQDQAVPGLTPANLTYLYIGSGSGQLQYFSMHFRSGSFTRTLAEARQVVEELQNGQKALPDVIVFDIPLNKKQHEEFCQFLRSRTVLASIPLLYNEKRLDADKIKYLKHQEMIDDVLNIHHWGMNYAKKISFLKKIRKQAMSLQVSKPDHSGVLPYHHSRNRFSFKRAFDVVVSGLILLCALPFFLLIALAIRLESRGPVFYTSLRAGKGFRVFRFYKFRTMEVDADKKVEALSHLNKYENKENGVRFLKIYNDPRVTRVGKILRKTSLDELPQLFNVILGDMSLVGNRPLPIYEATTLTTNEFVERFMAPAGMTGLWQIKKKKNPDMTAEERVSLDISYARQYNLLFDFKIIARTPAALFQKNNS